MLDRIIKWLEPIIKFDSISPLEFMKECEARADERLMHYVEQITWIEKRRWRN